MKSKATLFVICLSALLITCKPKQAAVSSDTKPTSSGKATHTEMLDDRTYKLTKTTTDKTYGSEKNPIKVGGGPSNEYRFLNALIREDYTGIGYYRKRSCCAFKTPNGFIDNMGLLDHFRVYWDGCKDTVDMYINMYDYEELKVPVGFRAKGM